MSEPPVSLDSSTPKRVIEERVSSTIAELGLTDVCNNRIGNAVQRGISGGQKRRVTIGSALVTMPKILILDEPTSGLDSRTSREVLSASACAPLLFPCNLTCGLTLSSSQERREPSRHDYHRQYTSAKLGDVRSI